MKFGIAVVSALLLADEALSFMPQSPLSFSRTRPLNAVSPADLPVVQANPYGQPTDVRYSDFLKLVNSDRIEKVTFSSDGQQLLGVDVDGARIKIEYLPNDPSLLSDLTKHNVRTLYV